HRLYPPPGMNAGLPVRGRRERRTTGDMSTTATTTRTLQEQAMTTLTTTAPPENADPHGVIEDADGVTGVVLRAMARAPNPRLREIMESFVRHLHAFARETRLTEAEYDVAMDVLNRIGKATHDAHNEGIL